MEHWCIFDILVSYIPYIAMNLNLVHEPLKRLKIWIFFIFTAWLVLNLIQLPRIGQTL